MTVENRKMKAAVLEEFKTPLKIQEVPIPTPEENEVLIKIKASALCVSDLHIQDGIIKSVHVPYIPGHEMAGEVVEVGSAVKNIKIGDRVLVHIDIVCGKCRHCREGKTNLCENLTRIGFERDGSHAQFCKAPQECVFNIGDMKYEYAACLMDAVGCMYNALKEQGKVKKGDKVLILGCGGIGMNAIKIAKLFGAEVYTTSRKDSKLEVAKQLGADVVINTAKEDLTEAVKRITNGELCDVIIDNIGIKTSVNESVHLVRPGGKVLVAGYNDPFFEVDYQEVMKFEKEIIGIRGVMRRDVPEIIDLVKEGKLEPYIYDVMPFEKINEALQIMREGKNFGRIVLKMD